MGFAPFDPSWHHPSRIFRIALQQLDGDALRAADEADAHAGADGGRLLGERDAFGLDLGGYRVDVLHRQAEMVEPLIGGGWWRVDAVAGLDLGNEDVGAAELDVDAPVPADDDAAEHVLEPGCHRLRIGRAQVNVIPGNDRHWFSPSGLRRAVSLNVGPLVGRAHVATLTAASGSFHPLALMPRGSRRPVVEICGNRFGATN